MRMKLSDISKKISKGSTPRGKINYSRKESNYFLRVTDMVDLADVYNSEFTLSDEDISKNKMKLWPVNTILVSIEGTVGKISILKKEMTFNQAVAGIVPNEEIINPRYLTYYLRTTPVFSGILKGTIMPALRLGDLSEIEIDVPDMNTQNKIVAVVDSITKKLKLNTEINNNLLEQIKSIYNETFHDFVDYKRLDEISNVTIGKTPPRSEQECFTMNKNDIKWISISDLGKSGMFVYDTSEKLTKAAIEKYNVKIIPKDTVILSFKLTIGKTGFTTENMATNEAIAHFDLIEKNLNNYLYCALTYFNYSDLGSTSSIATAINSKIVKSIKVGIPQKEQLDRFNNLTSGMFKLINNNESENRKLSQLRDILLPKLMNGEIDLDKIEI